VAVLRTAPGPVGESLREHPAMIGTTAMTTNARLFENMFM
jgi:hypothetical protein